MHEVILVTNHARERMAGRGVGRPVLEAVLRNGAMRWLGDGLLVACELLGWRAVVDPLRGTVVTFYEVAETRRMAS